MSPKGKEQYDDHIREIAALTARVEELEGILPNVLDFIEIVEEVATKRDYPSLLYKCTRTRAALARKEGQA